MIQNNIWVLFSLVCQIFGSFILLSSIALIKGWVHVEVFKILKFILDVLSGLIKSLCLMGHRWGFWTVHLELCTRHMNVLLVKVVHETSVLSTINGHDESLTLIVIVYFLLFLLHRFGLNIGKLIFSVNWAGILVLRDIVQLLFLLVAETQRAWNLAAFFTKDLSFISSELFTICGHSTLWSWASVVTWSCHVCLRVGLGVRNTISSRRVSQPLD